jgi:hypothetical protein
MIQQLIDATPADGTLDLTGQSFTVAHGTRFTIPRSMTIVGGTVTVDSATSQQRSLPVLCQAPTR